MSVAGAQPTSGDILSVEAALDSLFEKILESLKQIDIFSSSNHPIVFPVYAHDNPVAGTSHAWCVIQIIKWLEAAGCRVISDRTPLLPHHGLGDENENAAIRNILSSQLRLLPRNDDRENTYEPTYANKVLVFSSEVLRQYCVNAAAEQYVQSVAKAYKNSQGQPRDHLKSNIRAMVEENARNGSAWFHHVLTEIAFMKIRKDHDCLDHGIIPVALDADLPFYLPFFNPTDLVLKQEMNSLYSSDLHQLFFKIILQIYPKQHLPIEKFKECYIAFKDRLTSSGEAVIRTLSDAEVVKCIRQVYESILQRDGIAARQSLRDPDGHQGIEQTKKGPSGNTTDAELSRKRAFLSKLATVPYRDRKDRNPEREEGTCEWFKHHSKFQEWQQSQKASLLWVSADPGCGKSVLSKYLVDEVLPTTDKQMSCYFFFKDDLDDQRTLLSSFRCLLHQIFEQNLSLLDMDLLSRFEKDGQLLNSRTDLWKILIDIFRKQLVEYFVCILDGFDECAADDRSFLMKSLKKLYMEETAPPLKLLLTSRPYEHIVRGLRKLQKKELVIHLSGESEQEMDKISREIDIVIQNNVDDLGEDLDLEPDVTDLIKNELTKVENRTYLWVSLMIDILKNTIETSKSALKTVIQQLPRTVSAAYEKILSREQNDETNAKTRRLLHIVLASKRAFSTDELAVAFSISEDASFDEKAISRNTKFIREFSRLLVVIRNGEAYLAHQTVKEFLLMESPQPPENALLGPIVQWEHSFHPHHSHFVMAKSCMSYLEQFSPYRGVLLDYAARNWPEHFRMAGDVDEMLVTKSRNLCDSVSKEVPAWFERCWDEMTQANFDPPANPTSLIVASALGLKETVELLLNVTNPDLNARDDGWHRTAFSWACHGGHLKVGKLLLDWVAERNAEIFDSIINAIDHRGNTALHNVIIGHPENRLDKLKFQQAKMAALTRDYILSFLLSWGANTNSQNFEGKTPLHIAATFSETLVELLLRSGANRWFRDQLGQTALHNAAYFGKLKSIRSLLKELPEIDFDDYINDQDSNGMTPLLLAIDRDHKDVVKGLLRCNADVDLACKTLDDQGFETPLSFASECGNLWIFERLLEDGADVNSALPDGSTPLHRAIKAGEFLMAEILLNHGADVNFASHTGLTPLLQAIAVENDDLAELLLYHGADVDPATQDGVRPLLHAITNGYCRLAQLLLDHGEDVNFAPVNQLTPLRQAIMSKNRDMVELLIDYGADVNTCRADQERPLFFALISGVERDIITLLLKGGADINSVSRNGRTLLSLMISAGDRDGLKLLLDLGADIHARVEIDGRLPLSEAIWLQKDDSVEVLLDYGACVNDYSCLAEPPIITAIKCGRADIVQDLVNRGASTDAAFRYLSQSWIHGTDRQNALLWSQNLEEILLTRRAAEDRDLVARSLVDGGLELGTRDECNDMPGNVLDQGARKNFFDVVL